MIALQSARTGRGRAAAFSPVRADVGKDVPTQGGELPVNFGELWLVNG
jgi:hypothetical protein